MKLLPVFYLIKASHPYAHAKMPVVTPPAPFPPSRCRPVDKQREQHLLHRLRCLPVRGVRHLLRPGYPQHPDVRERVQADGQAEGGSRMPVVPRNGQQRRHREAPEGRHPLGRLLQPVQFHFHRLRPLGRRHVQGHPEDVPGVQPGAAVPHSLRGMFTYLFRGDFLTTKIDITLADV